MSGPSERQIHKFRRDYAVKQQEQLLDVALAIERLHKLSIPALKRATTRVDNDFRILIQGAYHGQLDARMHVVELMSALPLHLMASLAAQQPLPSSAGEASWAPGITQHKLTHTSTWDYLTRGLNLLGNLCGLLAVVKDLADALQQDANFTERVLDLVNLVLVGLVGPEAHLASSAAQDPAQSQEAIDRAAVVPAALNAVLYALQPKAATDDLEHRTLCVILLQQAGSAVFLDVIFDAVALIICMVRSAMLANNAELDLYLLAYHAGVTMQVLAELSAVPLFYHRLAIQSAPFAAPLRLIAAGLELHDPPLAMPPFQLQGSSYQPLTPGAGPHCTASAQGAAELLSARAMALMLCLTEYEGAPFLDTAVGQAATSSLLSQCVDRIVGYAGLVLQRPKCSSLPVEFTGEGQMHLNALHLAETLADDSNFRQRAMEQLAAPVARALLLPPQDFASAWLAGQEAFDLHSKDTVNDSTYLLLSSMSVQSQRTANIIKALAVNFRLARPDQDPGSFRHTLALEAVERCTCLFVMLGNLHFFTPASCPAQLQNYFSERLTGALDSVASAHQQSRRQVLQLALSNLQSLYQHNQLIFQVAHQHVQADANMVLSQDELQLGVKLLQDLTGVLHALPAETDEVRPSAKSPDAG